MRTTPSRAGLRIAHFRKRIIIVVEGTQVRISSICHGEQDYETLLQDES
ncbi:MAG: hypothetical protein H5U29_08815 [Pusillimonas sp.]|nr:hypothetical protein [Pusillimonas sp.]